MTVGAAVFDQKLAQERASAAEGHLVQARALNALLGDSAYPARGVRQSVLGDYSAERHELRAEDFLEHLAGDGTVAVHVVQDVAVRRSGTTTMRRRARMLAFDLDDRFGHRLALLADVLERHGLAGASIATSGSSTDRGKVVIFFARWRCPDGLRRLGEHIAREAGRYGNRRDGWGSESRGSVSIFPLRDSGGLVRVAGRNIDPRRGATSADTTFSIYGEPKSFADVVPVTRVRRPAPDPVPIQRADMARWVREHLRTGMSYGKAGTPGVIRRVYRIAHEAVRLHGISPLAERVFRGWLHEIDQRSPGLKLPSPRTGDLRNPLGWDVNGAAAYRRACERQRAAQGGLHYITAPLAPTELCSVTPSREDAVLAVLAEYVQTNGLRPHAFTMSYRQIAKHCGLTSAPIAQKLVRRLVDAGRVVIHDRGLPGARGLNTMLGLVAEGQMPDDVLADAAELYSVRRRLEVERPQYIARGQGKLAGRIIGPAAERRSP